MSNIFQRAINQKSANKFKTIDHGDLMMHITSLYIPLPLTLTFYLKKSYILLCTL